MNTRSKRLVQLGKQLRLQDIEQQMSNDDGSNQSSPGDIPEKNVSNAEGDSEEISDYILYMSPKRIMEIVSTPSSSKDLTEGTNSDMKTDNTNKENTEFGNKSVENSRAEYLDQSNHVSLEYLPLTRKNESLENQIFSDVESEPNPFSPGGTSDEYIPSTDGASDGSSDCIYPVNPISIKRSALSPLPTAEANCSVLDKCIEEKTKSNIKILQNIVISPAQNRKDFSQERRCYVLLSKSDGEICKKGSKNVKNRKAKDLIQSSHCRLESSTSSKKRNSSAKISEVYNSPHLLENRYKKTLCKFCGSEIISKHFARHLQRKHNNEREVREIYSFEKQSSERQKLISLIRNEGNLESAIRGAVIPKRRVMSKQEVSESEYAICVYCKGYFKRLCLSRHVKKCFAKEENVTSKRPLSESVVYSACRKRYGEVLNKLLVKKEIFSKMIADEITNIAINDILIIYYGEDLLKKNKNKRNLCHISNKLRECGRFLKQMRLLGTYPNMLSTMKPEKFDEIIEATKIMSRYDAISRSFGAASLALHFGTTLKNLSNLALKLILRGKIAVKNLDDSLKDIKRFRQVVESQWSTELGSLALKDLNEKASIKPKLLPVTEDIMKLKKYVEEKAAEAFEKLQKNKTQQEYRILVETTLVSTILHNRKRVGDVQYLDLTSYKDQVNSTANSSITNEITASLSEKEKILTQHYKRIVAIGKGSRLVTILIPKNLQNYFSMISTIRSIFDWFPTENNYLFTYPKSLRWIDGCSVIRKYAKICGAKYPELLTSCRLRKHIATVSQVLNLKRNEIDQLAKFMGHTTKTHENFYKLPQDVYQVAKVSKILQLMERGNTTEFKNKSLEEIEIDMESIGDENEDDQDDDIEETDVYKEKTEAKTENIPNIDFDNPTPGTSRQRNDDFQETVDLQHIEYENESLNSEESLHYKNEEIFTSNAHMESENKILGINKKSAKKIDNRQRWDPKDKKTVIKYFKTQINERRVPRKQEVDKFYKKFPSFSSISLVRIKTLVYNTYRDK